MRPYKNKPLVLFYGSTPRAFCTTLIGHLFEISQAYSVVLLSEELDSKMLELLKDKKLFPKLDKIIRVHQHTGSRTNLISKNRYLCHLAKKVIRNYQPDIVIASSDWHSLFEMYLMRFAKKINAVNVCFQAALQMKDMKEVVAWSVLSNAHLQYPQFLPLKLRLFLAKFKKFLGHFIYYWILPLIVGQKPFLGGSSFIFWRTTLFPQIADYQVVFSERDYNSYIKNGFPAERIFILFHPLERKTKEIFEKIYPQNLSSSFRKEKKILTIMWSAEMINFRSSDYSSIPKEELLKKRIKAITLISQILKGWKIFIKPHPNTENIKEIKEILEPIFDNIKVVNPQEPAEKYIEMSDVIVGLPPASTTIFIASLQCPEKPILSLNLAEELLGNYYEDFEGVEYIDNEGKLAEVLKLIRGNHYQKKSKNKKETTEKEFFSATEAIETLYVKKFAGKNYEKR